MVAFNRGPQGAASSRPALIVPGQGAHRKEEAYTGHWDAKAEHTSADARGACRGCQLPTDQRPFLNT